MEQQKGLRIGVIGTANRGRLSLLAHQPQNNVFVTAAADIHLPYLQNYQQTLNAPLFITQNYREIFDHCDAVMILSPDYLHTQHAIDSLRAGKDIFLEKPMATNLKDCRRILKTAKKYHKKVYVGHNLRSMNFIQKMKGLIDSGLIGEVKTIWVRHFVSRGGDNYFKDWHADRKKSNSLLVHKGIHDLDAIQYLAGSFAESVQAMGALSVYGQIEDRDPSPAPGKQDRSWDYWPPLSLKGLNPVVDVEDLSLVQIRLENGVLASYQECHFAPDYWRNYTIIGTQGRIENFGCRCDQTVIKVFNKKTVYNPEGDLVFPVEPEGEEFGISDHMVVNNFIDYVRFNSTPLTAPQEAFRAVSLADMATMSLRKGGKPLKVPKS